MIGPAAIFLAFNLGNGDAVRGWAIPTATDIAFVLAVLAVVSSHLPTALRAFLLTLAVVDDLLAVTVIAIFAAGPRSTTAPVRPAGCSGEWTFPDPVAVEPAAPPLLRPLILGFLIDRKPPGSYQTSGPSRPASINNPRQQAGADIHCRPSTDTICRITR